MGNFHIKRKGCSYVLVVKKVVLVFLMLFSRTKSTAGTFASELTIWNEVVWYVRIDISEGRKKNSSKVHKTASGYLLEIVFTLSDEAPLPPHPPSSLHGSPPVSANLKCFSFKAPESKKYIYRLHFVFYYLCHCTLKLYISKSRQLLLFYSSCFSPSEDTNGFYMHIFSIHNQLLINNFKYFLRFSPTSEAFTRTTKCYFTFNDIILRTFFFTYRVHLT